MSSTHLMSPLEEELVRAIATGSLEEAGRLLTPFSEQVAQKLGELPAQEREDLMSHVSGLFRWAMSMVRTERAQACARLTELPTPSSYQRPRPIPGRHLLLEG
jgi:hypothetical protein